MASASYQPDWTEVSVAVRRIFLRRGARLQDADDLVQEAIRKMLSARPQGWESRNHAFAYAATVAHGVLADHFLSRSSDTASCLASGGLDQRVARFDLSSQSIEDDLHIHRALRQAVADLPEGMSSLLLCAMNDRGSFAELARKQKVHRGTIARQLRKALRVVRERLLALTSVDARLEDALTRRGLL